ncbi:PAS domain S-box protein [Paenibacillus frigoriresistens]|uniref:PAS domain-containing sensor histidine kinase n=1 Tax=Paenibacillus alginolyticus TaxID=59839 RepID=UPI0015645EFE|nr:PAS domain-containing sensor histidine kinase [Paenibacillus frigoriresistens]NRF92432.1 PAS domain S-box protein [Paenibacillus frigoriresistens]
MDASQLLMNLTSDGIAIVDINGTILEVNKKFEELHGWTREEVIGKVLPMTPDNYIEDAVMVLPMKNKEGFVIGFVVVERDSSEMKKVEEELIERENQFRMMIKLYPEPIILHKDGFVEFVNDAFCILFGGTSSDDFKGRTIYGFFCSKDKDIIIARLQQVMQSDSYTEFMEIKLRKLDGTFFNAEVSSIYVHKNMGFPVIQTVIRDLTERKKSEEAIIGSEKLSLIGQLAAGIAHDIRNPLTSLQGFVQLLKAKNADYVDIMMEELEHINYVVNEFMTLAKPHLNDYMESKAQELVQSVVGFLQPHAHLFNVQIQMDMDQDFPAIYCIPDQIKQVLITVLKNAIESMTSGGLIQISFRDRLNQGLVICVEDQGVGISDDRLSQLGEPFFTTKANGTGLGLMVCKRIIEGHGGKLSIQSIINHGTTVEIELPFK